MNAGDLPKLAAVLEHGRSKRSSPSGRVNVLQSLLDVQEAFGSVPLSAVGEIARSLEVTEADVAGVLSYYPELRTSPPGRHLIRLCTGESCVANHCGKLLVSLQDRLKIAVGETTADGRFTLQRIYCVGNCAVGPSLMVDEDVHGRVGQADGPDVAALLERYP